MVPFTFDDLIGCRRTGERVDLVVRRPGEVISRIVDVVVMEVHSDTVTVAQADGTTMVVEIATLVDAAGEQTRRRSRRYFGHVLDAISSIWK